MNEKCKDNQKDCNSKQWKCTVCGYVYDGDPLPDHYTCPVCGAARPKFEMEEKTHDTQKDM